MRIHSEDNQIYIQALATSISKDPASLEHWQCLHIEHTEGTSTYEYEELLHALTTQYQSIDCDIVHCSDNDVLLISRQLQGAQLYEIADELIHSLSFAENEAIHLALYDLFYDWRTIRQLLLSKTDLPTMPVPQPVTHDFGELGALEEVFREARKLRRAREPMHVMLVEDDPLTRRLVVEKFKQHYALITAESAQEAVANYLLHAPDIVFLDIGLPDASGFEVLHQIIACDPAAYVVMFSSNSYLDNVTTALGAGAAGFVAKPFHPEKMHHYIQDSIMHHQKQA